MNLKEDYTFNDILLKPDYDGEAKAVLISSKNNTGNRQCVLYLHGYVDYFFHPHLGEEFNQNNFDFYALDLRKHGRSLMKHQHPNYCKDLKEYFEEISIAIDRIKLKEHNMFLMAHSTGGLTASCYMNSGMHKNMIAGLILNSPFLDFYLSKFEKKMSLFVSKLMSKLSNYSKIDGVLPTVYAQSLHKDYYGSWKFNLDWKPIKGFPTYFKWVLAINKAQKSLEKSKINIPVLIMHSSGSAKLKKFSRKAMCNDIVLNINDIKRVGEKLGNQVHLLEIKDAQHDIFLSLKAVREEAFEKLFFWLENTRF